MDNSITIPCPPAPKKNYNLYFDNEKGIWQFFPKYPVQYLPDDWDDIFDDLMIEDDHHFFYNY